MPFPSDIAETLLVACHRHCCICHKPTGNKMEIDHIIPQAEGGPDTAENGIPLCFDCHAEVHAYNPNHPRGRKFTPSELRRHRDQWFNICALAPWQATLTVEMSQARNIVELDEHMIEALRVDDRKPAQRLAYTMMLQDESVSKAFAECVFHCLTSPDEETRWKAGLVVEELVLWEPRTVPTNVLVGMSKDTCFAVRSSAAVCCYHLAGLEPASVPLRVLSMLASHEEDWYVMTPATSALLRLARARPVAVDILASGLANSDRWAREHSASAITRLVRRDWDLLPDELVQEMLSSSDPVVQKAGAECQHCLSDEGREPMKDYSLF